MWKFIAPFLVSMIPVLELRGGVLLGMGMGLDQVTAVIICVLGNMLPVPFVYYLARKVLTYGADKNSSVPPAAFSCKKENAPVKS